MVLKSLMRTFGAGAPSVDTVLATPAVRPGEVLQGQVELLGGDHRVEVEHLSLGLVTRVEVESGSGESARTVEFWGIRPAERFAIGPGDRRSVPFHLTLPWETPVTAVFGQSLSGMTMGVRTTLAIARAVDQGDLDPLTVLPLPAHEAVLEAVTRLGFRFRRADLEAGHLRGVAQQLPFYQEIEFSAAPQYARAMTELEVTFVTSAGGVDVVLEADKRGGIFTEGRDVYHRFHVPHAAPRRSDWAVEIDQWLRHRVAAGSLPFGL